MPRRRKHNEFFLGSKRLLGEEKDKLTDDELESMTKVAERLGESTEVEGLAERIGWKCADNKDLDEKVKQVQKLRDGWVMKKTKKGNTFVSVGEVKIHKVGKYTKGRIQITVPEEWIGYTAMVVVSKNQTPKFKSYVDEVGLNELKDCDPSEFADIVVESKGNNQTETSEMPRKRLYEDEDDERNEPNYDW